MSNVVEYENIIAFHPGYYVSDYINDAGINKKTMAHKMGIDLEILEQLLDGQISVSDDLAHKLSLAMGTSAKGWLNLQKRFDDNLRVIEDKKIKCLIK